MEAREDERSVDNILESSLEKLASEYVIALRDVVGYEGRAEIGPISFGCSLAVQEDLLCVVEFSGSVYGFFSVSTSCDAISESLGLDPGQFSGPIEFQDACAAVISEMLNGVAGGLCYDLGDEEALVTLLPPRVVFGRVKLGEARFCGRTVHCEGFDLSFSTRIDSMRLNAFVVLEGLRERYAELEAANASLHLRLRDRGDRADE